MARHGRISGSQLFPELDSPLDEPIDYSQLSSRWKENKVEEDRTHEANISCPKIDHKRSKCRIKKLSEETPNAAEKKFKKTISPSCALTLTCHLDPLPNSDCNGNLKPPITKQLSGKSSHWNQNDAVKGDKPSTILSINSLNYPYNGDTQKYIQQSSQFSHVPSSLCTLDVKQNCSQKCSQSSQSHVSSGPCTLDVKQKGGSELTPADLESCSKKAVRMNNTELSYHPKLKYLVLLARQSGERTLSKTTNGLSCLSSITQNSIKWREEKAGVDNLEIINDYKNITFLKSGCQRRRLSSPKTVQEINNKEFNTKPDCPLPTCPSSNITEPHHPTIATIPASIYSSSGTHTPKLNNESPTSDQIQHGQGHEMLLFTFTANSNRTVSSKTVQNNSSSIDNILNSINRKSSISPYPCGDCGKKYSTSGNLARHCQKHKTIGDKTVRKCPYCHKAYLSVSAYNMHLKTHRLGCECPYCGKKCSRTWLLQGHIRTHTGEKPFPCPQCGKSFADKSNLRAHVQTHSPDKPFVCGRCQKTFSLKSYLYKHQESACLRGRRKSR